MNKFLLFLLILGIGYVGYWFYINIFQANLLIFLLTLFLIVGSLIYYNLVVEQ